MGAPSEDIAAALPVASQSYRTHDAEEAAHHHDHSTSTEENAEDDALYEGMDSVADLTSSSANGDSALSVPGVDFSKMTVAERREHSRRHSRVHSRNLSVFFPRPGTEAEAEADVAKAREHFEQGAASTSTATNDAATKVHLLLH
ncbi:hypothetical protein NDA16_003001 [Ustilago loliicola]|nr:hypothetical protein NDA16_003001 [Ustilago loliicola]